MYKMLMVLEKSVFRVRKFVGLINMNVAAKYCFVMCGRVGGGRMCVCVCVCV